MAEEDTGTKFKNSSLVVVAGLVISMLGGAVTIMTKINKINADSRNAAIQQAGWRDQTNDNLEVLNSFRDNVPINQLLQFQREEFPTWKNATDTRLLQIETKATTAADAAVRLDALEKRLTEDEQLLFKVREDLATDEDVAAEFRLVTFPGEVKRIDSLIIGLEDIAGDNEGKVNRLTLDVDENSEARKNQVLRAAGRIKDHERRDQLILENRTRIDSEVLILEAEIKELHRWRESLSVGKIEILIEELTELRKSFEAEMRSSKGERPPGG